MQDDTIDDKLKPGKDIDNIDTVGRYKIVRKLGQGGSCVVYMGLDPYIKRIVAIKLSKLNTDRERSHFFVEAQSAGRLSHPNIKNIATVGQGECFGEMAYISGRARTATVVAETDCILLVISAPLIDNSSESIQLRFFKNFALTLVNRFTGES